MKPSWITDSIKAQRRLPEEQYQLRNTGERNKTKLFGDVLVTQADQESLDTQEQATPEERGKVPEQRCHKGGDREEKASHDCTSPEFLQHYFSASRLHHLSSWKQQWQQELSAFLLKEDQEKKETETLNKGQEHVVFGEHMKRTETIIMHVDIDCFFVSVTVREHPELRGLPVVVCHGSGETSEIACASYEARQYGLFPVSHTFTIDSCNRGTKTCVPTIGVHNGMCFSSAKSLCPNVVAAPYAFKAYEVTSRDLYQILLSRTHNIQVVSCDEAVVDISAFCQANKNPDESLRASAERAAEGIRREFFEKTKCTCSVGIGIHPLSARVACGLAKPDGVHAVLTVEETCKTLSPLDLESIPSIGWSTKKALQSFMGITKCGELALAPREQLERLLGKKRAATIQDFARGHDTRTIVRFRTRASVGLCVTWGVRLKDVNGVNTMMNNIAAELCKRLKHLGVAGSALSFSVCSFPCHPPPFFACVSFHMFWSRRKVESENSRSTTTWKVSWTWQMRRLLKEHCLWKTSQYSSCHCGGIDSCDWTVSGQTQSPCHRASRVCCVHDPDHTGKGHWLRGQDNCRLNKRTELHSGICKAHNSITNQSISASTSTSNRGRRSKVSGGPH